MAQRNGTPGKDNITPTGVDSSDIVKGNNSNDILFYLNSTADNDLFGEAGNDVITGGSGNDLLDGGEGEDSLKGNDGSDTLLGGAGEDNLNAGDGADTLDGGLEDDTLSGGEGADFFYVGAGKDKISDLGDGADILVVAENATANAIVTAAWTADSQTSNEGEVNLTTKFAVDVSQASGSNGFNITSIAKDDITLTGSVNEDYLTGGSGDDTLIGNEGEDYLDGGFGADVLNGGLDDDTYTVDNASDVVNEAEGEGTDSVISSVDFILTADQEIEVLNLVGKKNLKGTGNSYSNAINGNRGNNVLNGGEGIDSLTGGLGNDTYIMTDDLDLIIEEENEGIDLVLSDVSFSLGLGSHLENLTLTVAGNTGEGNELANVINGSAGNDTLIGGDGTDVLDGNGGDDTYVVNIKSNGTLEDKVIASTGNDTIEVVENYTGTVKTLTVASNVENFDISGTETSLLNIKGNSLNNTLTGNEADNLLNGGVGNDSLLGNDGDDLLIGGKGQDTLTGGLGEDTFRFDTSATALNKDTLFDFVSGEDKLEFTRSALSKLGASGQFAADDQRFYSSADGIAHDKTDRLIFNTTTGELSFDSNGSDAGGSVVIEVLGVETSLAATDIWVV